MDKPNIRGWNQNRHPLPNQCKCCMEEVLDFELLQFDSNIEDAVYYSMETDSWYCTFHWQERVWKNPENPKL